MSMERGASHCADVIQVIKVEKRNEVFSQGALPEYLKWGKYSRNDVPSVRKDLHGSEGDLDGPCKTQDHVFYNGTIVVCLKNKTKRTAHGTCSAQKTDPLQAFRKIQNLLLNHQKSEQYEMISLKQINFTDRKSQPVAFRKHQWPTATRSPLNKFC